MAEGVGPEPVHADGVLIADEGLDAGGVEDAFAEEGGGHVAETADDDGLLRREIGVEVGSRGARVFEAGV